MTHRKARPIAYGVSMALCLVATGKGAHAADPPYIALENLGSASGAQIYNHICQACHMARGEGAAGAGRYPKLSGDPTLASWRYVALTVLAGRNGMPAFGLPASPFGQHLSDVQVAAVVNYVRTHFGNHFRDTISVTDVSRLAHPTARPEF